MPAEINLRMHCLSDDSYVLFIELTQQHEALRSAVATVTTTVNARGDMEVERLQDIRVRIREVALHGVREGAIHALAATQLRDGADLHWSLTPHFVDARHQDDYDDLVEAFVPLSDAVVGVMVPRDIVNKVFLGP